MFIRLVQEDQITQLNKKIEIIYESKLIIDNLQQSILIMTPEGKIHFANDSYIRYFDCQIQKFMDGLSFPRVLSEHFGVVDSCLIYVRQLLLMFSRRNLDGQE